METILPITVGTIHQIFIFYIYFLYIMFIVHRAPTGWMQKVTNAELYRRIDLTENLMQKIITRKLELFGHICRMENDRKIKSVVFRRLDGTNERGRPHKEWMDNITDWCGA